MNKIEFQIIVKNPKLNTMALFLTESSSWNSELYMCVVWLFGRQSYIKIARL